MQQQAVLPGPVERERAAATRNQDAPSGLPIDALLARMRRGDREAAAEFMERYGSRVRRRIRGKLAQAMRRVFDSQEILSTVGRRLDMYVRAGRFRAEGEAQLWSLIFTMADNALVEKARVFRRLEEVESKDSDFAASFRNRLNEAEAASNDGAEAEINDALRLLPDAIDRQILTMWLLSRTHADIARELGMEDPAVRKRWERIKSELRARFEGRR